MGRRTGAVASRLARFLAPAMPTVAPAPRPAPGPSWARPLAFTVDLSADLRAAWLGFNGSARRVSREEALRVPAVKRVRDLIAATIGRLPVCEFDPGWHEVENELLAQPEADVPRSVTYAMTAEDVLFEGDAWWRIIEFTPEGWPRRVRRLEARSVLVQKTGRVYVNSETGQSQGLAWEWVPDGQLIRFDSPCAPLLVAGAQTIRDAMAIARAAARNVENPIPVGYVTPTDDPDVVGSDEEVQEILDQFEDSLDRSAFPYLNGQLKLNTLSWNPEQLQLNATRDAVKVEVALMGGVDPEELGVSTTSRTYANAEQRRLDLLEFTVQPYVTAIYERLSMDDVTFPGNQVRFRTEGFLKADTAGRMDVYAKGKALGLYPPQRLSAIEEVPVEWIRQSQQAVPAPSSPSGAGAPQQQEVPVQSTHVPVRSARFTAPGGEVRFGFDVPRDVVAFKADAAKRTVSGLAVPWNVRARSMGYTWEFAPNSLHWSADSRVKLDKDHEFGTEFGVAQEGGLKSTGIGLTAAFKVGRSQTGDDALNLAEDGVYDGFSVFVTFDGEGDGYEPHPDDPAVRRVYSATLRKVALTAMPAFDDARVQSVAATRNGEPPVTAPVATPPAPPVTVPGAQVQFNAQEFAAALTAGFAPAVASAVVEAIKALPSGSLTAPTRQVVPAGGARVTREAPVYAMNGQGPSFVRDAWRSRTQGDLDARDRLIKFEQMTSDMVHEAMAEPAAFAVNTGNAGAVIPPGFRPDLYVSQLLRGRPLTNMMSRGTIADATPFKIPSFVSSSGATGTHVEGVNPSDGSLSVGTITVSPGGVSGKYTITREIADSSNPAIDAIATQAMSESWSQQTEGLTYAKLNGTDGVGGVITADFVPSGAQAYTSLVDISDDAPAYGKLFARNIRSAMSKFPFRRFSGIDWAACSQEGATLFAEAVDTTGRPLFPWTGAQNVVGTANTMTQGYLVDGLAYAPAWSMSGNTAGDADLMFGNRNDVWTWESPVLNFRFEEVSGPANVVLALFGYFAVEILRPVGLAGIRVTIQA